MSSVYRSYKLNWTLADGTQGTKTTDKMKKQTLLGWDLLEVAGIKDGTQVRTIELLNNSTSGGARIYDIYIRVPDTSAIGIATVGTNATAAKVTKHLDGRRIVIEKNGGRYTLLGTRR